MEPAPAARSSSGCRASAWPWSASVVAVIRPGGAEQLDEALLQVEVDDVADLRSHAGEVVAHRVLPAAHDPGLARSGSLVGVAREQHEGEVGRNAGHVGYAQPLDPALER